MTRTPRSSLRQGLPVWLHGHEKGRPRIYPSLKGRREVDVAIVGGGMTGALVASTFALAGVSVCLVEAGLVGRGSTAASSALLLQEPDHGMTQLTERYGRFRSARIWQLSHDAVRDFIKTLKRLKIACELVERDSVYYATNAAAEKGLRAELSLRSRAGFEADWLTSGALRRLTGIVGRGAIRTRGNAHFNPYKVCLGLLRAAVRSGAEVFERSAVKRVDRIGVGLRVHTPMGCIDAARVVIATGYATSQFRPLVGRFRMYHTYLLATPRLSKADRRELGLGDVMVWDTERPYHYARWTSDNRLLLGGADRPVRAGERRDERFATGTRELREDFERLLPALADIGIDDAWEGLFAMTPDSLPYIGSHPRYPGHLFALGYGGNGMTFGFLAAGILLEQWRGIRSPDHQLFHFGRMRSVQPR